MAKENCLKNKSDIFDPFKEKYSAEKAEKAGLSYYRLSSQKNKKIKNQVWQYVIKSGIFMLKFFFANFPKRPLLIFSLWIRNWVDF